MYHMCSRSDGKVEGSHFLEREDNELNKDSTCIQSCKNLPEGVIILT